MIGGRKGAEHEGSCISRVDPWMILKELETTNVMVVVRDMNVIGDRKGGDHVAVRLLKVRHGGSCILRVTMSRDIPRK